jgi:predicted nucleic acid-binding protein
MAALYLDSSALLKLIFAEAQSDPLRRFLEADHQALRVSSQLACTEVLRACRRLGSSALPSARALLQSIDLIALVPAVTDAAAELEPPGLRTLDAIHLASALTLRSPTLVAYDHGLLAAAERHAIPTVSPGGTS